jgi:hypothetical protein
MVTSGMAVLRLESRFTSVLNSSFCPSANAEWTYKVNSSASSSSVCISILLHLL